MTTIAIKTNKLLELLFANITARKLCHSDLTSMLRWYQVSVKNLKKNISGTSR